MNIKIEILTRYISEFIKANIKDFDIDASQIADTTAICVLSEIQKIIKDENYSDFEAVEEIISVFEKYNIDFGFRHNF